MPPGCLYEKEIAGGCSGPRPCRAAAGFTPIFYDPNAKDARYLGVRVKPMLESHEPPARIAVVTSSPPMAEGGHMVIARELTQALREAGHDAHIVVTPQNRFGRQASAYLATWLTDVTSSEGRPIDQVDQPALSRATRSVTRVTCAG